MRSWHIISIPGSAIHSLFDLGPGLVLSVLMGKMKEIVIDEFRVLLWLQLPWSDMEMELNSIALIGQKIKNKQSYHWYISRHIDIGASLFWVWILSLSFTNYVTLVGFVNFPMPQFFICQMGVIIVPSCLVVKIKWSNACKTVRFKSRL